ncbi:MAG: hypothetical protein GY798_10135 [Hyphomicrobiales bacterium]|nr:hypothetical protein [Hyphomicrobiales bacterium]
MTEPRPGWFVGALCDTPGETHPAIVSILPLSAGVLQFTFMMDLVAAEQGAPLPPGEYVLCEGVGELD